MIRTVVVPLTVIPGFAYRQKLPSGGSGIVVLRPESAQPGVCGISRSTGEPVTADNLPAGLFPTEAFREAVELTSGLPYGRRGAVKLILGQPAEAPETDAGSDPAEEEAADSPEYAAIASAYTDKNGRLSPELLNRDLIRFAKRSSVVRSMLAEGEGVDRVRAYITGTKFRTIARNPSLDDARIRVIAGLMDEAVPRGLFRELNETLRSMAARR